MFWHFQSKPILIHPSTDISSLSNFMLSVPIIIILIYCEVYRKLISVINVIYEKWKKIAKKNNFLVHTMTYLVVTHYISITGSSGNFLPLFRSKLFI